MCKIQSTNIINSRYSYSSFLIHKNFVKKMVFNLFFKYRGEKKVKDMLFLLSWCHEQIHQCALGVTYRSDFKDKPI